MMDEYGLSVRSATVFRSRYSVTLSRFTVVLTSCDKQMRPSQKATGASYQAEEIASCVGKAC